MVLPDMLILLNVLVTVVKSSAQKVALNVGRTVVILSMRPAVIMSA